MAACAACAALALAAAPAGPAPACRGSGRLGQCQTPRQGNGEEATRRGSDIVEDCHRLLQAPLHKSRIADLLQLRSGNKSCSNVRKAEVRSFKRRGFAFVKQVMDPTVLDALLEEALALCRCRFKHLSICQVEQLRWQVGSFRDLMLHSAIGCATHKLLGGAGARVESDALFGARYSERKDPDFFSYTFHVDKAPGAKGVLHGFPTNTPAASAWFPLHDLDHERDGGSLQLVQGYHTDACRFSQCLGVVTPSNSAAQDVNCTWRDCIRQNGCNNGVHCLRFNDSRVRTFSFKKGDVLFLNANMPHATQPVAVPGVIRFALTVRFVDSEAILCNPSTACGTHGSPYGCCKDLPRRAGERIHTHCFPQVSPSLLQHEVDAHYSERPNHLMADLETTQQIHAVPPNAECA